ncbi:GlgB N-terminal domain-containing protein, partial [Bifidobacterium sp. UBA6881]|uniref:GlgB N-terminal domain-containing protein n=1 Tax=Bifidobacterium sp. UBA6881 TaxID=1946109 RepID=UPI0025C196CF
MATDSKINEDIVAVPVPQNTLDAVSNGTYYNPHEVLGGHLGTNGHEDVVTIRALRPMAKSVAIITQEGRTLAVHEHNGVFMALVPAIATDTGHGVPDYRIRTEYEDGSVVVSDDPYRYLPTIGDVDTYLFGEGRHERLWEALGAHVLRYDDPLGSNEGKAGEQLVGTAFTVWAPNAHAVRVVGDFNGWDGRTHAMREIGSSGIWELFVPGIAGGTIYKYELLNANNEWVMKADPMERSHEIPPRTGSIVVDTKHVWRDDVWMKRRAATNPHNGPVSIYEVHASSWRKDVADYRELADKLVPYVRKEGFTHVEFMPLAQHPFSGSWGYQVTGYYAIDSRLGGPDDFKYLVEKMHEAGIGVIMDWVPAHFPKDAFALGRFDGTPL